MHTAADILKTIAEHLGLTAEDLDKGALLREELGLGPIELNDLFDALSRKYQISFDPQEIEDIRKVEDLLDLVEDNLIE